VGLTRFFVKKQVYLQCCMIVHCYCWLRAELLVVVQKWGTMRLLLNKLKHESSDEMTRDGYVTEGPAGIVGF